MTKNLIIRIALAGVFAFSLHSCRTEDELISSTQKSPPLFETFTSKNGESVNYPRGYRSLLERYDSIHGGIHTRKAVIKNRKAGKAVSTEYIELSIRSQELMVKDNSERWILYPMVKDRSVTGIAVGILKNEETSLEFWGLDTEDAYYREIINLFRLAYTQKLTDEGTANKGGGCGWNEGSPCNTGEVIINVPKPGGPKGNPNLYLPGQGGGPDPGVIGGGCGMYGDCGGGGGSSSPNPNQDIINELKDYPCAQNLVKQLPDLKNDIAEAMKSIFDNNENYDIIFKIKSGLGNVDGTTFSSFSTEFGTFRATINLNDNVLRNATKEYILVTMYHEVVHAYLDYKKFKLGDVAFQDQYPSVIVGYDYVADGTMVNRYTFIEGHQQVGAFLTTLQNILSNYNPSLPIETVKAMAKAGITTMTNEEKELNQNERDTSLGKQKGTKCP
ncbi:hypothetical protein [Chryseobacterium sp. G0186]|uniref:hypothetical protein n=1 Tax=Chryseobacterium sp. G0186 TaxID=2487064 RepID=UPI000F4D6EE8|nr:hypothetical protein [Chryseobacterium sp. G0186]